MKYKILLSLCLVLFPILSLSQNLNPTVEVSNSYIGKLHTINKPKEYMAVPDSLLKFNLDFNYSVFDNPYKGAYKFNPYIIDFNPKKEANPSKVFYLKAGLGYALRPTLNLVFSPKINGNFKLNLFANHSSYIGRYRNIVAMPKKEDATILRLVSNNQVYSGDFPLPKVHNGYSLSTNIGLNTSYNWAKGSVYFDTQYNGIHTKDSLLKTGYNGIEARFRVKSINNILPSFYYDVFAECNFGADAIMPNDTSKYSANIGNFKFYGSFSPIKKETNYIQMDYALGLFKIWTNKADTQINSITSFFSITPKYIINKNKWNFELGLKLSIPKVDNLATNYIHKSSPQYIYPAVFIGYNIIDTRLNLYSTITGGDNFYDYISLKKYNPFFNTSVKGNLSTSVERVNCALGLRGNINSKFKYNVNVGYKILKDGLLDDITIDKTNNQATQMSYGVKYGDYNMFYSNFSLMWEYGNFSADGYLKHQLTNIYQNKLIGFAPSSVIGNIRLRYNFNNRVLVGTVFDFATSRYGWINSINKSDSTSKDIALTNIVSKTNAVVPGYVNVCLNGEYVLNRRFSVWTRINNLLGMTIQRVPLYPDGNFSITGGICLKL